MKYNYTVECCPKESARRILSAVFSVQGIPDSLIDVGCGNGSWLAAASGLGVKNLLGIDGAWAQEYSDPRVGRFEDRNFEDEWVIPNEFTSAVCMEVAEHLSEAAGRRLVRNLCQVSQYVLFSAACPNQQGQGHISCHWPQYWQSEFNRHGFTCAGDLRLSVWDDVQILPWYRQNMFIARRDPCSAGKEARLLPLIHPEMLRHLDMRLIAPNHVPLGNIVEGSMPLQWYLSLPFKAILSKILRNTAK
jgi:hypothetical protein